MHPSADANHVRVIVLPRQPRGLLVPPKCRARSLDLVRRDLLTVSRAADHHPEAPAVSDDASGRAQAVRRVVVVGVVRSWADVDHLVADLVQRSDQNALQLIPGMVGSDVDAHATECVR
jgi:hypothetical protein